ncbi:hypothetical protein [Methylibium sp.]|uniref:hypothetical protein n=1 Tax=Methylibium sp. TaxID=2067992 RepID=UPI003BABBEFF
MALELIPPRVPLTDPRTGSITREWYRFFQALYQRAGGSSGETPEDLAQDMSDDGGLEELKATTFGIEQQFGQLPTVVFEESNDLTPANVLVQPDVIEAQLQALRDEVAELKKQVQALEQGVVI